MFMNKLTGYQRFLLVKEWVKRKKTGDREAWIRQVCEVKGLEYVPPVAKD